LYLLPADADVARIRTSAPTQPAVAIELNGDRMHQLDDLFREFVREFRFPEYFGWNWPAFAECMGDLSWYPARAYLVCIRHPEFVLDESPADRDTFYRIMNGVCTRWAHSFGLGPEWGGGEVPFKTVFLCDQRAEEIVRAVAGDYL
jgi:hypothetical protein